MICPISQFHFKDRQISGNSKVRSRNSQVRSCTSLQWPSYKADEVQTFIFCGFNIMKLSKNVTPF